MDWSAWWSQWRCEITGRNAGPDRASWLLGWELQIYMNRVFVPGGAVWRASAG